MAYKASQTALRLQLLLSAFPLSQDIPYVSYIIDFPASQVSSVPFASRPLCKLLSYPRELSSFKSQPRHHSL